MSQLWAVLPLLSTLWLVARCSRAPLVAAVVALARVAVACTVVVIEDPQSIELKPILYARPATRLPLLPLPLQ